MKILINEKEFNIHTFGLRDHTFGLKREWRQLERYVLHFIQLDNGDAITIGVLSIPVMFKRLFKK